MGHHKTYVSGEKPTTTQFNAFRDYVQLSTYAEIVAAVSGFGVADRFKHYLCEADGYHYYWTGTELKRVPAAGGGGGSASKAPYSFIVYKDGSDYVAEDNEGNVTYGGSGDAGAIDGAIFQNVVNAAITAVNTAGGGIVFLKNATYTMSLYATYGAVELASNVDLIGEDMFNTLIVVPTDLGGYQAAILVGDGTNKISNVALKNFAVNVNSSSGDTNYGEMGVWIRYGENILCERLFIQNACGWGIRAGSASTTKPTRNVLVDKCKIINCRYDCVQFIGWDTSNRNCWETEVTNSYFAHAEGGVVHYNAEKGSVNDNIFVDLGGWGGTAGHAIVPHGTTTTGGSNDILIDGNIIVDNAPAGIYNGISVYYDSYNITITNNLIYLSVNRGINIQLNGRNHIVKDNFLYRGTVAPATNTFHIYGQAVKSIIAGNIFSGDYAGDYAIYMWIAAAAAANGYNQFKNNYFYQIPKAMWLLRSSENDISGNYFYDDGTNTTRCIVINTATPDADYNKICNNNFVGISAGGAICITLGNDPLETIIADNKFRNCTKGIEIQTGTNTRVHRNSFVNVTTLLTDAGTNTIYDTVNLPLSGYHTFLSADGASWGAEIDAANEYAIFLGSLPPHVNQVRQIRIKAVGLAAPGAGNAMNLQIDGYAGADDEAEGTETIAIATKASATDNTAVNDYIHWLITASDDADIDDITGGDTLQIKVQHDAAGGGDIATDAVFQTVEVDYV